MKGPEGEWRPDDPVGCAVHVARIATGRAKEVFEGPQRRREIAATVVAARLES